jgi:tellurite resistance protein
MAGFSASFWSFSFGATALASAPILMVEGGQTGLTGFAATLFAVANMAVLIVVIGTLRIFFQGRLLP